MSFLQSKNYLDFTFKCIQPSPQGAYNSRTMFILLWSALQLNVSAQLNLTHRSVPFVQWESWLKFASFQI
jgi:hypothetical protein